MVLKLIFCYFLRGYVMMMVMNRSKKLSKGIKKFIRKEKARIRREVLDLKEQKRLISELVQKFDQG